MKKMLVLLIFATQVINAMEPTEGSQLNQILSKIATDIAQTKSIKKRSDGRFISGQIQPIINKVLSSEKSINSTPEAIKLINRTSVSGLSPQVLNGIIRYFVFEGIIDGSEGSFSPEVLFNIEKHMLQKNINISLNREVSFLISLIKSPLELLVQRSEGKKGAYEMSVRDLSSIEQGELRELNSLEDLESLEIVDNDKLTTIEKGAFDELGNLKELRIDGNDNLEQLQSGCFRGLVNLETLIFLNNDKLKIQEGLFEGLDNLKRLEISDVILYSLEDEELKNTLKDLKSLEKIKVYGYIDSSINRKIKKWLNRPLDITSTQ